MKRLHTLYNHEERHYWAEHWLALKEQVQQETGIEPFSQIDDITTNGFQYLNSYESGNRFEILEGDAPYNLNADWIPKVKGIIGDDAGPVECELSSFMLDVRPLLGILIGGMGSGKSTSLRHLSKKLSNHTLVHYLNCDKKAIVYQNPPPAASLLTTFLSNLTHRLVPPQEEFEDCWDWALDQYAQPNLGENHSAVTALAPAVNELRIKYGEKWNSSNEETISFRREQLYKVVCRDDESKLDYIALLLDYYLTVKHNNKRSSVCIVLDNVDPLPPGLQRELLLLTSQVQLNARCKVLISMRPLTYSLTHGQRATRTIQVIQHTGPTPLQLIADRVKRLIEDASLSKLRIIKHEYGAPERIIDEGDFKSWIKYVMDAIVESRPSRGSSSREPSASEFINGLCNNSLRSALLVAEKIFGSPNFPMVTVREIDSTETPHVPTLRNHDIIRAILLGQHHHYEHSPTRITDNIFDLGSAANSVSATVKFRLLKELASSNGRRGMMMLDEIKARLSGFGYDNHTILDAVNGAICQVKRLAWSDKVAYYASLDDPKDTKLSISKAGRFYVEQAVYSLEYVQEVHVDVLLPFDVTGSTYNHRSFSNRISSLYKFLRYLHDMDIREVRCALVDSIGKNRYIEAYGHDLFSSVISRSLIPQIQGIGNSMLRRWRGDSTARDELEKCLSLWGSLDDLLESEDRAIVATLNPAKA